jgi:hypothetical protein
LDLVFEFAASDFFHGARFAGGIIHIAIHEVVDTVHRSAATEGDQLHFFSFAGLKANGSARRYIEPHPEGFAAVKFQLPVHFKKMKMRAYLYRPVAGVHHFQHNSGPPYIALDIPISNEIFSWYHFKFSIFNFSFCIT